MAEKKLKVFVTGGRGFIGRNFVETFQKKHHIYAPNHKDLDLLNPKVTEHYFKNHKIDVVVHLANRGGNQKEACMENLIAYNLKIFFNLVRNQKHFKKMLFVGSGSEYGKQFPIVRIAESDFDRRMPEDDFGFYKYVAAKFIEKSENIINLRVFGIYGKYEDWRYRFISNAICKALYKKPVVIDKNVYFDYLYVNDFLRILDHFICHNAKYKSYNIGTGNPVDLESIAKAIVKITNISVPVMIRNAGLGNEYTCSNARFLKEFGKFQFTPLYDSLMDLTNWYKTKLHLIHEDELDPKRYNIWAGRHS